MFATLALVAVLTDFEHVVRHFAGALQRRDATITATPSFTLGTFGDVVEWHDGIAVRSARLAAVEKGDEGAMLLLAEVDATAVTLGRRRPVAMPRWWSIEVRPVEGGWQIESAMTLEQRLAVPALQSREALSAAMARPDVDPERFLALVAARAPDLGPAGCDALLWVLDESRARGLPANEAYALHSLSWLALQDPRDGVLTAQQSVDLARRLGDPAVLVDSRFALGIAYWMADRIDEAVEELQSAAPHAGEIDDPRFAMRSVYMAFVLEMRRNRMREALRHAERAEELAARYPTPHARMDAAHALGEVHWRLGNFDIARQQFHTALAASRLMRDRPTEAMALYNMAMIELSAGQRAAGTDLLRQAISAGEKTLYDVHLGVLQQEYARQQQESGDLQGAHETLDVVIAVARQADDRTLLSTALAHRADLRLLEGRVEEALADAREARRIAESGEGATRAYHRITFAGAMTAEGRALLANGQREEAEAVWRTAIDVAEANLVDEGVDETGSAAVGEEKLAPYRELLDLLVEQGCAHEALLVAERMRARSLRDALRNGRIDLSAGLDPAAREQERALEQQLAAANRALLEAPDGKERARLTAGRDEARLALRRFRSGLYLARSDLRLRRPETFDDYAAWRPAVAPGEVVVELVVTPAATYVFSLRGERIEVHRIAIRRAELEKRVNAFVAAVEQRDFSYRVEARALYRFLLGSVDVSAPRLRIVPDGVLWRLPFHVLIDARGRHLGEAVSCSYSPSLAPRHGSARPAPRGLFALGDPAIGRATVSAARSIYRDTTLGALPDAAVEARAIAKLYADAQVRIGAEARESAFKSEAGAFRVLHLAAHSIVDDGAPMFSSIVLASSGRDPLEDGLLEAREIAGLKLQADVAVLSGCETARGRITPGEGMVGLSWAFLAAGVPTTVVSQWKVGSDSTAALMVEFHRRLRDGATSAEALRGAMLALRRDPRWRHPFYWAPFVVVENGPDAGL